MAAITDLNWAQVNEALKQLVGTNVDIIALDSYGVPTNLLISSVVGSYPEVDGGKGGVVKFLARLHDACVMAQEAANTGKVAGEQLKAFQPAIAGTAVGTFAPISRTLKARHDLSSSTKVIGTNT